MNPRFRKAKIIFPPLIPTQASRENLTFAPNAAYPAGGIIIIGLHLQYLPVIGLGIGHILSKLIGQATIIPRLQIIGANLYRFREIAHRLIVRIQVLHVHVAKVVPGLRIGRVYSHQLLIAGDRLIVIAMILAIVALVIQSIRSSGVDANGIVVIIDGQVLVRRSVEQAQLDVRIVEVGVLLNSCLE